MEVIDASFCVNVEGQHSAAGSFTFDPFVRLIGFPALVYLSAQRLV